MVGEFDVGDLTQRFTELSFEIVVNSPSEASAFFK